MYVCMYTYWKTGLSHVSARERTSKGKTECVSLYLGYCHTHQGKMNYSGRLCRVILENHSWKQPHNHLTRHMRMESSPVWGVPRCVCLDTDSLVWGIPRCVCLARDSLVWGALRCLCLVTIPATGHEGIMLTSNVHVMIEGCGPFTLQKVDKRWTSLLQLKQWSAQWIFILYCTCT